MQQKSLAFKDTHDARPLRNARAVTWSCGEGRRDASRESSSSLSEHRRIPLHSTTIKKKKTMPVCIVLFSWCVCVRRLPRSCRFIFSFSFFFYITRYSLSLRYKTIINCRRVRIKKNKFFSYSIRLDTDELTHTKTRRNSIQTVFRIYFLIIS